MSSPAGAVVDDPSEAIPADAQNTVLRIGSATPAFAPFGWSEKPDIPAALAGLMSRSLADS